MKKLSLLALMLFFSAATVFAVPFTPVKMTISAEKYIHYTFNGQNIDVPVTMGGVPGTVLFSVFTNDKAKSISRVRNGYLGWHFVNKIDTCIFVSDPKVLEVGKQSIVWNGKDETGNNVPEGTYTYYLWGYDSVTPKIPVTRIISMGWNETSIIRTHDEQGVPLTQPEIYTGGQEVRTLSDTTRTHSKWVIGGDPNDSALLETTLSAETFADKSPIALLPSDHTKWFKLSQTEGTTIQIVQYKWVPNGTSIIQSDWGDNGYFTFDYPEHSGELHNALYATPTSGYLLTLNNNFFSKSNISELIYIDAEDGSKVKQVNLADWWVRVDDGTEASQGQAVGGPTDIWSAGGDKVYLNFHGACLQQVIDPTLDGDITDMTLWANLNGDNIGDHNDAPGDNNPWVCFDYVPGPYMYDSTTDALGFSMIPTYDLGAVSFGLFAPDGTGIKYFAYANDAGGMKDGNRVVDYNSAYDGIYTDNANAPSDASGWWYVAHDSIKGIISNIVGVADASPSAFTVAQNSPNPFNPSTTITFNLAKAGKTTVEVYNVAGQKVSTLVNGTMSAGSHSVVWNAAKFSAGVYFYTVKSGSFSKTMKMTLLK